MKEKELKTLKELKGMDSNEFTGEGEKYGWKHIFDIKKEAIKWIKYHNNKEYHTEPETLVEGFMNFFNLTEEDLKNERK